MSDDIWKDDVLGRHQFANELERLISLGPGVINVDAPYGFGKTFLLDRLATQLGKSGHACIQIDAWSSDFHTEPVFVLFSEFTQQLAVVGLAKKGSKLAKSAKAVGKSLLRRGVPAAVKAGTLGAIDLKDMGDEIAKGQLDAVAEAAGGVGGDLVSHYMAAKQSVREFKTALEKAVRTSAEQDKRLVVILDELDRCRPDYALSILEIVKHLFLVEGVTFVLGADMKTLARAVNVIYGIGSDVGGYLGRLIDCTIRLPTHFEEPERFANHLARVAGDGFAERDHVVEPFSACTRVWSPSFRDQMRAFRTLALTVRLKPHLGGELVEAITTLVCFKLYAPRAYVCYVKQNLKFERLIGYFSRRAGVTQRSREEIASQTHSFVDSMMASRIGLVATILALQMVDDRALRFALEGGSWTNALHTPTAAVPFGNYAAALQSQTQQKYERLKKLDEDLYMVGSFRAYLDEEISIVV